MFYYPSLSSFRLSLHFVFFFSSRRRHTRCLSDWSSDVCSSDLESPCPGTEILFVEDVRGRAELGRQVRDVAAPDRQDPAGSFVDGLRPQGPHQGIEDRKSTRLNSSHLGISYAFFCLKKKMRRGE